jgi:hypothetical protein
MRAAPAVSRAKGRTKIAHEHTGQRRQSDIPCAMALRLTSRSPRRIGLCCLRRLRIAGSSAPGRADLPSADLTPTTEASGPHDFTVRFSIVRPARRCPLTENRPANTLHARHRRVHRNPIPTFGDDGQRPFLGDRMAGVLAMICPTAKAKFCPTGCFVAAAAAVGRAIRVGPEAVTKRAMTL